MGNSKLGRFDLLVVVMFENRSLDNVLGYLYDPNTLPPPPPFDGVAGRAYSNPVPPYIGGGHAAVPVRMSGDKEADFSNPQPDPGEEYPHVNTQLFDIVNEPWNNPTGQKATMQGFVHDYCNVLVAMKNGYLPAFEDYRIIMDCFGPQYLPVINTLAREFAVFDAWHCAVPTQTFCNRSFFHASDSSGYVVNEPYSKWLSNDAVTIFNRLNDAGKSWKVYYDETQVISLTGLIHFPRISFDIFFKNFATMATFYADVANGTLPDYAFVEPCMFYYHNDYHPPAALFSGPIVIGATSDVRNGELLLHNIYSAVRNSNSETGSNALNTLLLAVFDEHGGTFDHVAPPPGVRPHRLQPEGEFGFGFDRLGVRVPAIAISAYTRANTVIHQPSTASSTTGFHHGTVIRTLCTKYDLQSLNDRDRTAPDLSDALNLDTPRDPKTSWPVTVPLPVPPQAPIPDLMSPELARQPLNALERGIVGLTMAAFNEAGDVPTTLGPAHALVTRLAKGAFAR